MPDPFVLDGATARLQLPLLFAGQVQKEVFVNTALAMLDGALHCAVEGESATPPAPPVDGTAWLVAPGATGEWAGQAGCLALRQAGQWLFVPALDGMQVLDRSRRQLVHRIAGSWRAPALPSAPTGGSTVDTQARQAIAQVVAALQQWGAFPA